MGLLSTTHVHTRAFPESIKVSVPASGDQLRLVKEIRDEVVRDMRHVSVPDNALNMRITRHRRMETADDVLSVSISINGVDFSFDEVVEPDLLSPEEVYERVVTVLSARLVVELVLKLGVV